MSTSGTYNFAVTRDDIIRQALLLLEKIDETESPTPVETTDMARLLNMLVKQWQGKTDFAPGLKTWTRRHGHLFLSSVTGQYTVGPGAVGWTNNYCGTTLTAGVAVGGSVLPVTAVTGLSIASSAQTAINQGDNIAVQLSNGNLYWSTVQSVVGLNVTIVGALPVSANSGGVVFDYTTVAQQPVYVETAFLRDITNEDTPLRKMTVEEYDILPSKTDITALSDPTAVYYEFQLTNSLVFTDVSGAQDVSKHICMSYMEAVQDFNNPLDNPSYPQEWFLALSYGLGKIAAPTYGVALTPTFLENYKEALMNAQSKEPERSVLYFQCYDEGV